MNDSASVEIETFFRNYESTLTTENPAWASIYHQEFLFGGPTGTMTIPLENFLRMLPRRQALAKEQGVGSTKLRSIETKELDDRYNLAFVAWDIEVSINGSNRTIETRATYLLMATENGPRIIAQIDHQDLFAMIKASASEAS
jgi:hypothetical protein